MEQQKQVILIGGVNGAGKTLLTQKLSERFDCLVRREELVMVEIGKQKGLSLKEALDHYDELIGETAERMANEFSSSQAPMMFIDCHYAIKLKKMLTLKLKKKIINTKEPYIQAIDARLIKRLKQEFPVRFVFVEVKPKIALSRIHDRLKSVTDQDFTIREIQHQQNAEKKFFNKILKRLNVSRRDFLFLSNSGRFEYALRKIIKFINS